MKFIDKKERVMDLKLTSYGHYLLSIGKFKPEFYSFYDDNVLYDGAYAQISESSNKIHDRIKNKTQYLESQVLFQDIDVAPEIIDDGSMSYYEGDVTPIMYSPRKDIFRFESSIGDAFLQGDTNIAPAWKVVSLQGKISSSAQSDEVNDLKVPQINIQLNYRKKIVRQDLLDQFTTTTRAELNRVRNVADTTAEFADGRVIQLINDDMMIYVEELNTTLLNENFDIEVYEVHSASLPARCPTCEKQDKLRRLYFKNDYERIMGGFMSTEQQSLVETSIALEDTNQLDNLTSSVGYYFDFGIDHGVDQFKACKAADIFNKQSLYIDLEFDCGDKDEEMQMFDIYGPVTEPEICL